LIQNVSVFIILNNACSGYLLCVLCSNFLFFLPLFTDIFHNYLDLKWGIAVAQWLRYCATNQKVGGSIPDGVIQFVIDINPSDRTMALRSTQPLTEMCTRSISWG
jgi:hypothetical protein